MSPYPNGILIGLAVSRDQQTDMQTDHAIAIGRILMLSISMLPKKEKHLVSLPSGLFTDVLHKMYNYNLYMYKCIIFS